MSQGSYKKNQGNYHWNPTELESFRDQHSYKTCTCKYKLLKKGRRGCLATLNLKNGWQVTITATAQSVNFKVKESENWMTLQKENSKIL